MRGVLVSLDLETTGLDPATAQIIEIGAVKFQDGQIIDRFNTLVDPGTPIPPRVISITGITQEMLFGAPKLAEVLPKARAFIGDAMIVGHNIDFDMTFMQKAGALKE